MKRMICRFLALTMLAAGIYPCGVIEEAAAEVDIQVNLGPPVIMADEPGEVVFVPDYGIYFVPGLEYDIFFYNGFWWSRRGARWYSSRYYRSGWTVVGNGRVPGPVFKMPRNYRQKFARAKHIRYQEWKGRPARPKNMQRGGGQNAGQAGNFEKGQQNNNNVERGGERGPENGERGGDNAERGGGREKGQQGGNEGEGGHR